MSDNNMLSNLPYIVWVSSIVPTRLDAATWLETTRELQRLGWRVTLIAKGSPGRKQIQGVEALCMSHPQVYFLGQWIFHLSVLRFLAREWATIDVILFHQISAFWLLPLRFVRWLRSRRRPLLVMDIRTVLMVSIERTTRKDQLRSLYYKLVNRMANRLADGRTAITQRMAISMRISSKQLWGIWPSGVNLDQFAPALSARRWPLPGEPIHLTYVGVLHYQRNLMSLCKAVEKANAEGKAFILSLIGDGTERLDLEKFALQTEGRVHVVPPVPHGQIPDYLAQAHVGVLPFPDEEIFQVSSPIKLFEYMAAGLPILSTRIVCHSDVVNNGEFAFWAENASVEGLLAALRQIWQHRDTLSHLSSEAAAAAQNWTWQAAAQRLSDALSYGLQLVDE